ncbi:hypothetical protein [Labrys okinawensis]|nr:hypothetical protein [Labrys okinawensis]
MSEQTITLLKLAMGRYPSVDVVVPGSLLVEVCNYYYNKQEAIAFIVGSGVENDAPDKTNAIYISDLEENEDNFSLLLVRGDPGRALPGFVNPTTRDVIQIEADEPGYVPGASCHVVISKQEIAAGADQGRFRVAIQRTRGIGRALVREFLAHLLAKYSAENPHKFIAEKKRQRKNEKPETISYRPTLRLHPQENGSLKGDLEQGRIGGFKLTRGKTKYMGEADEAIIEKLDVQLQAKIAPTSDVKKVTALINHIKGALENISFENLNLELVDDAGHSVDSTGTIAIDALDDGDMRYCKTISMPGIGPELTECHAKIFVPIQKFAMKCLNKPEYWK